MTASYLTDQKGLSQSLHCHTHTQTRNGRGSRANGSHQGFRYNKNNSFFFFVFQVIIIKTLLFLRASSRAFRVGKKKYIFDLYLKLSNSSKTRSVCLILFSNIYFYINLI